jgi:hypothetical protein
MLTNLTPALSVALILAAMAASKHAFRHHSAMAHSPVAWQMPATTHQSYGSTTGSRRVANPTYMNNQDIVNKQYPGD